MSLIDGYKLIRIMRHTLNKIDPRLVDHGYRVAYMVYKIMENDSTLSDKERRDITITSFLHDIGAYKTDDIDNMVEFETQNMMKHSIYGYLFLKYLAPLKEYAIIVLAHHISYEELKNYELPYWKWAQIVSICDRFDVLMSSDKSVEEACAILEKQRGTLFSPELLDLFFETDKKGNIIHEVYSDSDDFGFEEISKESHSKEELQEYLDMITYSIDFRSQFMVTHTKTSNRISVILARLMNLSLQEQEKINLGSTLHDLGKIGIPGSILDYPGKLDDEKMQIMRKHVEYTAEILEGILDEDIIKIASRHHEKMNGKGYPLGLSADDLSTSERIVAVADIISALYERRSYKEHLETEEIIKILNANVEDGSLDPEIVNLAITHFDEIFTEVHEYCDDSISTYKKINSLYFMIQEDYQKYLRSYSI